MCQVTKPRVFSLMLCIIFAFTTLDVFSAAADSAATSAKALHDRYYRDAAALRDAHNQKLRELEAAYREAHKAFSAENVQRSKALSAANLKAHTEIQADSQGRNPEARRAANAQARQADKQRRAEHAEWRNATAQQIKQNYQSQRGAEIEQYKKRSAELITSRDAGLARLQNPAGAVAGSAAANDVTDHPAGVESPTESSVDTRASASDVDHRVSGTTTEEATIKPGGSKGPAPDDKPFTQSPEGQNAQGNDKPGYGSSGVNGPKLSEDGKSFSWGDGTQVRAVGPDGQLGTVNEKGDIVYGDGTTVVHTGEGEIVVHRPDGSSRTMGGAAPTNATNDAVAPGDTGLEPTYADQGYGGSGVDAPKLSEDGKSFSWGDGTQVRAIGPDGQVGTVNEKGDIIYADGTTVVHTGEGEIVVHRPDGSTRTMGGGAQTNAANNAVAPGDTGLEASAADQGYGGSGVDAPKLSEDGRSFSWGDGTQVRAIGPDGQVGTVNEKGDIIYADGTTVVHTGEGEIVVHRPDGSSRTMGGDSGNSNTQASADGSQSSGSKDTKNQSQDTSDSDSGSDSSDNNGDDNDSGDESSGGEDSGESGEAEGGDDADQDTEGSEYYGENSGGRRTGPSDVVQGVVDRVTGQSREVETGVPEPCSETGGFGVTQPGPGGQGNCVPGHLPTVSAENDQQPDTPDAGSAADNDDARRATQRDIKGKITQPGLEGEGIPIEDLPSSSPLDRSPVVNPSPEG